MRPIHGDQAAAERVVDARGHQCPVPTLRLSRAMQRAEPGTVICLWADDPLARIDVPHYAGQRGMQIIEISDDGVTTRFRVRKA